MDRELNQVKKELSELKKEIILLRKAIQQLTSTCGRMDDHISFVDGVYETVRHPVQSILNRFSAIEIPKQIEYKSEYKSENKSEKSP